MVSADVWSAITIAILCILFYIWRNTLLNIIEFVQKVRKIPCIHPIPMIGDTFMICGKKNLHELLHMFCRMWAEKKSATGFWYLLDYYVLIGTAEDAQVILSGKYKTNKADIYKQADVVFPGLITSADHIWKTHRKAINPFFQASAMSNFVKVFSLEAQKFCKILEEKVDQRDFDINSYLEETNMHIFIENLIPEEIRPTFLPKSNHFMDSMLKALTETYVTMLKPWLHPRCVFNISGTGRYISKHIGTCRDVTTQLVSETKNIMKRKTKEAQGQSFLEYMMSVEESGKNSLPEVEIVDEFITLVLASWETTVKSLGFVIHMVSKHQDVQDKIVEEINLELGVGDTKELTPEGLNRLKYLEQVIKETLRFYAPVNIIGRKLLEDVTLKSGCVLPKGSNVLMLMQLIHRDPDMFPNPDTFNPDNFLPENLAKRPAYAYMPFSIGPRSCIGQKYAMLSLKANIVHVLRKFVISAEPEFEVEIISGFVAHSLNGIRVALKRRN